MRNHIGAAMFQPSEQRSWTNWQISLIRCHTCAWREIESYAKWTVCIRSNGSQQLFLEKLTVANLIKKCDFVEPAASSPCPQKPSNGSYSQPVEFSLPAYAQFLYQFYYCPDTYAYASVFPLEFPAKIMYAILISFMSFLSAYFMTLE